MSLFLFKALLDADEPAKQVKQPITPVLQTQAENDAAKALFLDKLKKGVATPSDAIGVWL